MMSPEDLAGEVVSAFKTLSDSGCRWMLPRALEILESADPDQTKLDRLIGLYERARDVAGADITAKKAADIETTLALLRLECCTAPASDLSQRLARLLCAELG